MVGCLKRDKTWSTGDIIMKRNRKSILITEGQDSATLDELRKQLFPIWKPQGKLWNKRTFLVNTLAPPPSS